MAQNSKGKMGWGQGYTRERRNKLYKDSAWVGMGCKRNIESSL